MKIEITTQSIVNSIPPKPRKPTPIGLPNLLTREAIMDMRYVVIPGQFLVQSTFTDTLERESIVPPGAIIEASDDGGNSITRFGVGSDGYQLGEWEQLIMYLTNYRTNICVMRVYGI